MSSDFTKEEELAIIQVIKKFNAYTTLDKNLFWSHIKLELKSSKDWNLLQTHFIKKMIPKLESYKLLNETQINQIRNTLSSKIKELNVDLNENNEESAPLAGEEEQILNDTTFFAELDFDQILEDNTYNPPTPATKSRESRCSKSIVDETIVDIEILKLVIVNNDEKNDTNDNDNSEVGQANSDVGQANNEVAQAKSEVGQANSEVGQANSEVGQAISKVEQANSEVGQTNSVNLELENIKLEKTETDNKVSQDDSVKLEVPEIGMDFHDNVDDIATQIKEETTSSKDSVHSRLTEIIPIPVQIKTENDIQDLMQNKYAHFFKARVLLDKIDIVKYLNKENDIVCAPSDESVKSSTTSEKMEIRSLRIRLTCLKENVELKPRSTVHMSSDSNQSFVIKRPKRKLNDINSVKPNSSSSIVNSNTKKCKSKDDIPSKSKSTKLLDKSSSSSSSVQIASKKLLNKPSSSSAIVNSNTKKRKSKDDVPSKSKNTKLLDKSSSSSSSVQIASKKLLNKPSSSSAIVNSNTKKRKSKDDVPSKSKNTKLLDKSSSSSSNIQITSSSRKKRKSKENSPSKSKQFLDKPNSSSASEVLNQINESSNSKDKNISHQESELVLIEPPKATTSKELPIPNSVPDSIRTQSESLDIDLDICDGIEKEIEDCNSYEIHHQNLFSYESLSLLSDHEFRCVSFIAWLARVPMNSNPKIFFNELTLNFTNNSKKYLYVNNPVDVDTNKIINFLKNVSDDLVQEIFINNWIAVCPEIIEPLHDDFQENDSSIHNNYNIKQKPTTTQEEARNKTQHESSPKKTPVVPVVNFTKRNTSKENQGRFFEIFENNHRNVVTSSQNQENQPRKKARLSNIDLAIPSTSKENRIEPFLTKASAMSPIKVLNNEESTNQREVEIINLDLEEEATEERKKTKTQTTKKVPSPKPKDNTTSRKNALYTWQEDKKLIRFLLDNNSLHKHSEKLYRKIAEDILPGRPIRGIEKRVIRLQTTGQIKQHLSQEEYKEYLLKRNKSKALRTKKSQNTKNVLIESDKSSDLFMDEDSNNGPSKKLKLFGGS